MIDDLKGKFNGMSIEMNKKIELRRLEQVANLSTYPSQRFKSFCYDDDDVYDYEKSTFPLNEIISQIPPSNAITSVSTTIEDPKDSLIIGNKDLSTILEKESDEFIKLSVKDLFPIPNESEDTSGSDNDGVNPLFKEVLEYIKNKDSYDSNLDEPDLLVTPLFDANEDECFDPGGDIDEIDAIDIPSDFEDDYYDSEEDLLCIES
nr:hypothetical protein [Tanacetum cinerariifolium]